MAIVAGPNQTAFASSGGSQTVFSSAPPAGSTVAIQVACESNDTVSSFSSSIGTFTQEGTVANPNALEISLAWYVCTNASGSGTTCTVSTTSGQQWAALGYYVTGGYSAAATGGDNTGSANTSTQTVTGLVAGDIVLIAASVVSQITTGPTGWTSYNGSGSDVWAYADGLDVAYQTVSGTSTSISYGNNNGGAWALLALVLSLPVSDPTVSGEQGFSYGPTTEVLSAVVNPNNAATTVSFNYGPTSGYGSVTGSVVVPSGNSPVTVQIPVSGLTLGDTYHFQCVATNSAGTTDGSDATFTTVGMPAQTGGGLGYGALGGSGLGFQLQAPAIISVGSDSYGGTIEVLWVTVNPANVATVSFNWGATNSYGTTTTTVAVPDAPSPVFIGIPVTGLTLGNTYHFQAVVANYGSTVDGSDQTFTTVGMPSEIGGGLGYGALGGSGLGFQPSAAGTITTAAISASMAMAATNSELVTDTAAITAVAALAATNKELVTDTVGISASAALAATNVQIIYITCAISCSASIVATNRELVTDTCAISPSCAVAATNSELVADTAAISCSSSLSATNQELVTETCAITGTASLSADVTQGTVAITAAISCSSSLAAINSELMTNSAALSASSSLAGTNKESVTLAAAIGASASFTAANAELVTETVAITATSSLSANVANLVSLTAAITGTSSVAAANSELRYLAAAISASSSLSASNSELVEMACAIAGASSLSASNTNTVQITAAIAAYLVLAASVAPPPVQGLAYGYIVASLALGSLVAASASGDALASSASGTLVADSASGDLLASSATGTIT